MSFTENQRKGYLLAIALMVIAIALVCGWMLRPDRETGIRVHRADGGSDRIACA